MNTLTQIGKLGKHIKISSLFCSQIRNKNTTESQSVEFNPNYENRNPRSLEWSGLQYKRNGWNLQYPSKDFYHQ